MFPGPEVCDPLSAEWVFPQGVVLRDRWLACARFGRFGVVYAYVVYAHDVSVACRAVENGALYASARTL